MGCFGVPLVWLVLDGNAALRAVVALAQVLGGARVVIALRLFESAARASGTPHVTDPTRRWARPSPWAGLSARAFVVFAVGLWRATGRTLTS